MLLENKHAIVTGGGSGIGLAITNALIAEGSMVTIMGRNLERLETVAKANGQIYAVQVDVTNADNVHKAIKAASAIAPIDILINNAGAAKSAPFQKINVDQWKNTISVNLDSVYYTTSAIYDELRTRDYGRVINIASTAGLEGCAYASAYSAAKHGVIGLTRSLALELHGKSLTVNAICPGFTNTDIVTDSIRNIMDKTGRTEQEALMDLLGTGGQTRLVEPEEVANEVIRLCDPENNKINGEAIVIDGN